MIKIIKIIIRRGGGGEGEGERTSRLWWQNFIINTSVCTEEVVRFLKRDIIKRSCNVTLSPLYCQEASPTSFKMIELIIKFRHHKRDVRPPSPSPPPPLLIIIFMIFIIFLMQTIIKIRHPKRDFKIPFEVAKIPFELASRVQVEEMVFYSVHNPAPSTFSTTPSSLTTPYTELLCTL